MLFILYAATEVENQFFNQGILGTIAVVLAAVIYKLFKMLMNDRDKAIQQRDELLDAYLSKVLPALNANTALMTEITDVLKENTKVLSRNDFQGGR